MGYKSPREVGFIKVFDQNSIVELWFRPIRLYFRLRRHLKHYPINKWCIIEIVPKEEEDGV